VVPETDPLTSHDTTRSGINVRADAHFDSSEIDFRASALVDEVRVLGQSAIIDWTTFAPGSEGAQVIFLGKDGRLTFSSALPDYAVINRISTPEFDSAVRLDGSILSTVAGGQTGGSIWFYSSGGLIVGSDATINVGSLLLTTNAPDLDAFGRPGENVALTGNPSSTSVIRVDEGAQVAAHNANAYVALVAPRVEQYGTVMADGSIAYVAAEEATLSIDHGLFGISVDVGTTDENGIVHGDSATSTSLRRRSAGPNISLIAIPKNDAINLLVQCPCNFRKR
jgi:filamentous hemagglutinin family protein